MLRIINGQPRRAGKVLAGLVIVLLGSGAAEAGNTSVIQALIDAASPGDIVTLPSGTFLGEAVVINKPLSLVGATDTDGSPDTIIMRAEGVVIDPLMVVAADFRESQGNNWATPDVTIQNVWFYSGYNAQNTHDPFAPLPPNGGGLCIATVGSCADYKTLNIVVGQCRFTECWAIGGGGAIGSGDISHQFACGVEDPLEDPLPALVSLNAVQCEFSGNSTGTLPGSDIRLDRAANVVVAGSTFSDSDDGSIWINKATNSYTWVKNTRIIESSGVAIEQYGGSLMVANSIISSHTRGIATALNCDVRVFHTTIAHNQCTDENAAGVSLSAGGGPTTLAIANSIFWDNLNANGNGEDAQFANHSGGGLDAQWSTIQGRSGSNPRFTDVMGADGIPGGIDADYRLLPGSPAIDNADTQLTYLGWEWPEAGMPAYLNRYWTGLDGGSNLFDGPVELGGYGGYGGAYADQGPLPCAIAQDNGDGTATAPDIVWSGDGIDDDWSNADNWAWSDTAAGYDNGVVLGPLSANSPTIDGPKTVQRLLVTNRQWAPTFNGPLNIMGDRGLRIGGFGMSQPGSNLALLSVSGAGGEMSVYGGGHVGANGIFMIQSPAYVELDQEFQILPGGMLSLEAGAGLNSYGTLGVLGGVVLAEGGSAIGGSGLLQLSGVIGDDTFVSGSVGLVTDASSLGLHVNGDIELGGQLYISPSGSLQAGDEFTLLSCSGSMTGTLTITAELGNGLMLRVRREVGIRGGSTLLGEVIEIGSYLARNQGEDAQTSSNINDAVLEDVNGDGFPDLIISAGGDEDSVHLLLNEGDIDSDGAWDGFATQITLLLPGEEPSGLDVADLSGDSLPEIAVALRDAPAIAFLGYNTTTELLEEVESRIDVTCRDGSPASDGDCGSLPIPEPTDVVFWNLDEDGDMDIVVTCWGDSSYRVYETTATLRAATFVARTTKVVPRPPWGIDPSEDEDTKDGTTRAMATNPSDTVAEVSVLNRGPIGDRFNIDIDTVPLSGGSEDLPMVVGDLDNNGYDDMVVAQPDADAISIMLSNDDGTTGGATQIPSPGPNPQSITLGDFDNDGDLDIAVIVEGTTGDPETRLLNNDFIESGGAAVNFIDTGEVFETDGPPVRVLAGNVDNVDGDPDNADDAVILTAGAGFRSAHINIEPSIDGPVVVSSVAELEAAVQDAPDGGEIRIAAGTYQLTDALTVTDRDLVISGPPSGRGTPTVTLIAPPGDRVFRFNGGQSEVTRLENLNIEGNDLGGGLLVQETTGDGPVIEDCIIQNCTFGYGAAIYLGSSDATKEHKLTVRRCSFELNEADFHNNDGVPEGDGGGIYAWNANLTVDGCAFVANSAVDDGGAILSRSSVVTLTESIFQMNNTPSSGGAIYTYYNPIATGSMTAENCTFGADDGQPMGGQLSNTCGRDGGAIYATSTGNSLLLIGCDFRDNDAARRGGAVIARDGASFEAYNSLFEANTTSGYGTTEVRGGAIYAYNCDLFNLNNCDFFDNESQVGGAVRQGGSDPTDATITDCEFRGNKATMSLNGGVSFGGAMDLYQSTPCILTRCTIVDNEAGDYGGGLRVASNTPVTLSDSTVCSNSPDQIFGTTTNIDGTWIADTCDLDGDGIPDNEDSWPYGPNPEIAGSLQQAVDNATNGDVISLATGAYISSAGAAAVVDTAGKEITIVGQLGTDGVPTSIIDGEGVRDGLIVENGSSATSTFQNLLIQHGAFGAYVSQSSALFDHCWFIDNSTTTSGAALYVTDCHEDDDHSVIIESCRFENNTALTGAGLYAADSTITIEDTDFEANESTASNGAGGAAYVIRSNASFASCLFTGNQTDGKGGALFLGYDLDSQPCIMTDCDFFSNYARAGGGAIRVYSENATLTGCRFGLEGSPSTGNTTSTPSYAGGAVEAYQGSLDVSNCQFHHNLSHYGGGVYVDNCHESLGHSVTLQSCLFTNNAAASGGGFYGYDSTITIQETDFDANESTASNGAGGAVYVRSVAGDAMLVELTMTDCTFTRNSAENTGGALWTDVADVTMESCIFGDPDDATAGNSTPHGWGGAVRLFNVAGSSNPFSTICSATIRGGGFYDNHAIGRGGAIYYKGMPLTIEPADDGSPCVFRGNTTGAGTSDTAEDDRGGAISIDDGSFAAEHDDGDGPILSVSGAIFENNSTEDQWGGALYLHEVDTEFTDCTFTNNNATIGGAIRCYRKTTTLTNCNFTGNIARVEADGEGSGFGGAISSDDSAVVASGCSFESNETEYWGGGGVHLVGADQWFDNCAFTNNTAARPSADTWSEGGAMYCFSQADDGSMTQLTLTSCSFTGNEGGNGGAVRNLKGSVLVSGGSYVDNAARGPNADGGALNVSDTSITVTSQFSACILSGNTADDQAGAVALVNCSPSIGGAVFTGVELIGNTADEGGAVLIYGDTMATFTYCVLTENQSPVQGSAIMISEDLFSGELELASTTICNNGPNPGSGVYGEPISGAWTDLGGNAIAEVCDGDGDGVFSGCDPDESEGDDCNEDGVIDTCQPGMEDDFTGGPASTLDWVVHDEPGANVLGPSSWSFTSDAVVQASNIWGYPDQYGWQPGTFLECRGTPTLNRNFTIAAALLNYDNDATGIAFCMQDPDTCYVFESIAEQGMSRLWLRESGVSTVLWQGAASIPTGSWCWVVVDVQGDAISVTVDGVVITSVTNTAMSGGTMAFWCRGNQGGWYDTLRISVPEPTDSDGDGIADCNDTYPGGPDPGVPGSLQTAVDNAVDGDVITLAAGLYELTDSLDFGTRNLSLIGAVDQDGASATTLLVTNSQRAIILDGGQDSSTRLENLIIDGNSTGGCLFVSNSPAGNGPVAQNVIFRNGFSSANAGAVLVYTDGHFTCISSRFENNTASHGGAVLVTNDGQFHASDCEFVGNTASSYGGAIKSQATCVVMLDGCGFTANTASVGGAIFLDSHTDLTATTCTFDLNSSSSMGSAIYARWNDTAENHSPIIVLEDCGFTRNTSGSGGTIYARQTTMTATKCVFGSPVDPSLANSAFSNGGAIRLHNGNASGSGDQAMDPDMVVTLRGCEFYDQHAGFYGGAILNGNTRLVIEDAPDGTPCRFANNTTGAGTPEVMETDRGGAIYVLHAGFHDDHPLGSGPILSVTGAIFENNSTEDQWGGALYLHDVETEFTDCTFTGNSATIGGAIRCYLKTTTLTNCNFTGNIARVEADGEGSGFGGAISSDESSIQATNCLFDSNSAQYYGGGSIYLTETDHSLVGCTFTNNQALTVLASTSYVGGGAIFCSGNHSDGVPRTLNLDDCTFDGNQAWYGGAVRNLSGKIHITGSTFTNNATIGDNGDGGAIDLHSCEVGIANSTFDGNTADHLGGAISLLYDCTEAAGLPAMENLQLLNNTADGGGAVFIYDGSVASMHGCTVTGNTSTGDGGAILMSYGDATFTACEFSNNNSTESGGAIGFRDSTAIATNCQFSNNSSTDWNGGAISMTRSHVELDTCSVLNNNTVNLGYGGGIYAEDSLSADERGLVLTSCVIDGNTSRLGGGVFLEGAYLTATESSFTQNAAISDPGGDGSAICLSLLGTDGAPSEATLVGCTVTGNQATATHALYNASGNLLAIESSTICDNTDTAGTPHEPIHGGWTDLGGNCISINCDSDADGTYDCDDGCPDDPLKTEPGECGCGTPDTDSDGDGIADCNDTYPGGPNPGVPDSLQLAVTLANDGDTIQLGSGLYTASSGSSVVDLSGKSLTIIGTTDVDGAPTTTIDGELARRGLRATGPATLGSVFQDLNFSNGLATEGGGVLCSDADLSFVNCRFTSNQSTESGGGLRCDAGTIISLIDCVIYDNLAGTSGGGIATYQATILLEDCDLTSNQASSDGGGLVAEWSDVTMINCQYESNNAWRGGGVTLYRNGDSEEAASLSNCTFNDNQADYAGAFQVLLASADVSNTLFQGNQASIRSGAIDFNSTPSLGKELHLFNCHAFQNVAKQGAFASVFLSLCTTENMIICGSTAVPIYAPHDTWTDLGNTCITEFCDSDQDGALDCEDGCPDDPDKLEPGICGCGVPDTDSDEDGTADCIDGCPDDPLKTEPGDCGCGVADEDANNNGVSDCLETICPGDIDGTGFVDIEDLLILLSEFGPCPDGCEADFDADDDVDVNDLLVLIGGWGPCP